MHTDVCYTPDKREGAEVKRPVDQRRGSKITCYALTTVCRRSFRSKSEDRQDLWRGDVCFLQYEREL